MNGERRGVHRDLVGKPKGKRPLARPRLRLDDIIKIDLKKAMYGCMDWIELALVRDRWRTLECSNEPSVSTKCREFLDRLKTG
jgi:hypothetical protein